MTRHDTNPPQKCSKQTITAPHNETKGKQTINNKTQTVHMQLRSHQKKKLNQNGLMTEKGETEIGRLRSPRRKDLPRVEKQCSSEQSTETSSARVDTDAANANNLFIDIKDRSSIATNTMPLVQEKVPGVDGNQNIVMNGSPGTPMAPTSRNKDRPLREQCLVIQGLQEPHVDTPKERVLADLGLFQGLLNTMLQPDEEVSVLKAFRLGKRTTEPAIPPHPRPLKIVLSCKEHVDLILSRRFGLKYSHQGVFFSAGLHTTGADKTPTVSPGAKAASKEWRKKPGYLQHLHNRATVPVYMDTARAYVATAESIDKGGVIAGLPKAKKLKCLYSNAQSLLSKLDELKIYVNQTLPDVISITETWLSASVDDREVALSGYHLFRKDRSGRQGGGVLTYVKYGLFASEKEGQLARTTETLWLTIKTPGSQPLEILMVYRPPRNDPQSDSSLLEELETISIRPNVMIMGDFNAPNIDWNLTSAPGSEFNFDRRLLKSVQRSHLTQHVSSPTTLREGQLANCLDLVLTKAPESVDVVNCLPPLGKSDHVVLQWEYSLFSVPDQSMVIGRNIWRGDFGQMRLDMRRRDWKPALTGCVLKDWLELKAVLNELITRYCPMSKKKITSRPRWLKCSLKVEVNRKQRLWKAYLRDKTNDSMNRYKAQRNRVKCLVYKARQDFEGNLLNYAGENPKLFFNYIRQSTRNRDPIPMIKRDDGVELYKDDEKTEHLSRFFQSVFTRDVAVPADHYNVDDVPKIDSVVLTKAIVQQELLKLKEAKSPGPDEIPAKLLKELVTELAEPLCLLFQASLDEGRLPPEWKTAWISPIHKSGSRASANNYRPVSLTSICCKVMGRIIKRELMRFLEQHHLLSNAQHGFRRGRSCLTNLLYCLEQWTRSIDEGNVVHVAYIDFKKAFDSVPHQLLLYKLSRIGVRGKLLKWIENFLVGRSQTVRLGGQQSAEVTVMSGVPQGSVLGPILFLIYIDDCIHDLDCDIAMFADDIKLWTVIRNEDDEAKLQANLDRLEQWSGYWHLPFNVSKCNILRIGRTSTAHRQTYYLNHTPLPVVEVQKDLGV
ncbi:hypothetical protein SprV_0501794400 [Sparganum proliferum]